MHLVKKKKVKQSAIRLSGSPKACTLCQIINVGFFKKILVRSFVVSMPYPGYHIKWCEFVEAKKRKPTKKKQNQNIFGREFLEFQIVGCAVSDQIQKTLLNSILIGEKTSE